MTPARDLLADLRSAGYALRADGNRLTVSPRGKLTPAECDQVRGLKFELLALLAEERAAALTEANAAACGRLAACPRCRAWVDPAAGADVRTACDLNDCPQ